MKINSRVKVSNKKIKNLVLNGIKINKNDNESNNENRIVLSKKVFRKALIIPIAAIFIIFSVTTIAANFSDGFRLFLTDGFEFLIGKSQSINLSDSNNGITMTVEAAINDSTSAMTLVKFTKDDGSDFGDNNSISRIELSSKKVEYVLKQKQLSDDKKALFYLIKTQGDSDITNNKFTLIAKDFTYNEKNGEVQSNINIRSLYDMKPINIVKDNVFIDVQNFSKDLLIGQDVSAKLEGIVFESESLYLYYDIIKNYDDFLRDEGNSASISYLINEKTDVKIYPTKSYNYVSPLSENITRVCAVFEKVDSSFLSDLKIVTKYRQAFKINGQWKVDYKLDNRGDSIKKEPNITVQSGDNKINISKIDINMLGMYVEGSVTDKNGNVFNDAVYVHMAVIIDNGETIKLSYPNSSENHNGGFIANSFTTKPIDISKIESVTINDEKIDIK